LSKIRNQSGVMPPFHPKLRTCLWNAPALGVAAIHVAGCGTRVSLGETTRSCAVAIACGFAQDASWDDSGPSNDTGLGTDAWVDSGQGRDSGPLADSPSDSTSPDPDGAISDATAGGNDVTGTPNGARQFGVVSNAWWIEKPDPRVAGGSVVSTVVYLFSRPVPCGNLSTPKWDENREPADTENLEIEMAWSGPTQPTPPPPISYQAVSASKGSVPPSGMAGVFYQVTPQQPPGPPMEWPVTSGTVILTGLNPNVRATGTFDVTFVGGHVTGHFDALYCPNGREP
jgi:hypothetical protein